MIDERSWPAREGDIVRHASGGPEWLLLEVDRGEDLAVCQFGPHVEVFSLACLELVRRPAVN